MQLENLAIDKAIGTILVHHVIGPDGHKALLKGRLLNAEDISRLRSLGKDRVYVAVLDSDDVREDDAAGQLARLVIGQGIDLSKPSGGRVNLYAQYRGFLRVNRESLARVNSLNGVTLSTLHRYAPVTPKRIVATLKTIGLALPVKMIRATDAIVHQEGPTLEVAPVANQQVAVVLTGSQNGQARVQETFLAPIRGRVEDLGAHVVTEDFVAEEEEAIANAILAADKAGAQLTIIAGETSIMDSRDITPRGIERAGGRLELYGAPVEPGNLLLLAYRDGKPIIGAPGCVKSRDTNVVDLILPPLLAGDRVTRGDVIAFGEGGLFV